MLNAKLRQYIEKTMIKVPYNKSPLSYSEQLSLLKARGLAVKESDKALFLLEHISYYRLSGYWYPLLADKKNHVFKNGASFETAFALYCFDKELRKLILSELEKIEVAIRAKITYVMSMKHGAFWFENDNLFVSSSQNPKDLYINTVQKINSEYERSDEEFVRSFREKYSERLPPSWILMEIVSFGSLSKLYQCLKPGRDKREIAHHFGLHEKVLASWLHSIVYLRNVCAHHARLWNRAMKISPEKPLHPKKIWIEDTAIPTDRTYYMLCIIQYFLQTINPNSSFINKLDILFRTYPMIDKNALGFSIAWEQEPLWQRK